MPPDLNLPAEDMTPLVPRGLVSSRVTQMVGLIDCNGDASDELSKKQKTSAAAAQGTPAGNNENLMLELPGSGATRGSSRSS